MWSIRSILLVASVTAVATGLTHTAGGGGVRVELISSQVGEC